MLVLLPPEIRERIKDAKALLGSLDDESFRIGIKELEELQPILEEYVKNNPHNPEGHLELSATFQIPAFISMRMDKSTNRAKMAMLLINYGDKIKKYIKMSIYHLEEFCKLSPNDNRKKQAEKLVQFMKDLEKKISMTK